MSMFDIIAGSLLLISGLVGYVRGATREVVTVGAFLAAVVAAIYALRFTGPIARQAIHPDWMGTVIALAVVFLVVYLVLRLIGAGLTRRVQETEGLGALDRIVGLGFGLVRALIVLGVFNLAFNAATPQDRVPAWISTSTLYPVSTMAADVLRAFAPTGQAAARDVGPVIDRAVRDGVTPGTRDTSPSRNSPPAEKSK